MDKNWSLDNLYESFDSPKFLKDFEGFKKAIDAFCIWSNANLNSGENAKEKLETFINMSNEISDYYMMRTYCRLLLSVDSTNATARKYAESLQDISTGLVAPNTAFIAFIKCIDNLEELIENSALLKEHAFYLKETKEQAAYILSQQEEAAISKMKNTGSNAWAMLHDQLTSTLSVDLNGEKTTLPMIRNMAQDENSVVRKAAFEAELAALKTIDISAAACLNAIKGEVITTYKLRGYDSPLDMTLKDSRMESTTLKAMLDAIQEYLPELRKYYHQKAKNLGYNGGLKYYDICAPIGEISMSLSYEKAAEYIVAKFSEFAPEMGSFAKHAFDNQWLDVEPRPGKVGGAFCSGVPKIKECRILSNFLEGSFDSMLTLAHELGHGYHGYCLKDEANLNKGYTMPIAETASTFCETLVCQSALRDLADEPLSKIAILENAILGATQVIVDIFTRYTFETWLFENRANGSLSVDELNKLMIDAHKKVYGDGLDETTIHPYMWIVKGHYYSAGRNFYNFPYAYGHMFSLGLYSKYLEEGESFTHKYKKLLAATGASSLRDVGLMADIDVNDINFWRSSLDLIKKDIEEYIALSHQLFK